MTVPNGEPGITPGDYAISNTGVSGMPNRTQAAVTTALKSGVTAPTGPIGSSWSSVFDFGGLLGTVNDKADATQVSLEYEVPRLDNRIDQLANGDTIHLFTSSGNFTKPAAAKKIGVAVVGGGDGGFGGPKSDTANAPGGTNGSYVFKWFDAADVPGSVTVTIGAPGSGGAGRGSGIGTIGGPTAGAQGTTTTFGTLLASLENGLGVIVSEEGIVDASLTSPGSGGAGGKAVDGSNTGSAGASTGWLNGGAGATTTADGGVGESVDLLAGDPFSGGGGGGGGASIRNGSFQYIGYRGGNGGWPGGGGAGGGAGEATNSFVTSGAGGNGAAGACRVIVKYS